MNDNHDELIAAITSSIAQLTECSDPRQPVRAHEVVAQIGVLLKQITILSDQDVNASFELLCKLLSYESAIYELVHDSEGLINYELSYSASQMLVIMSERLSDADALLNGLRIICQRDDYGTIANVLRQIAKSLPDKVAKTLTDELEDHIEMRKAIHIGRGQVDAYINFTEQHGELQESDFVTIADMYLDLDDVKGAETYLGKISERTFQTSLTAIELRHRWMMNFADISEAELYCQINVVNFPSDEKINHYRKRFGEDSLHLVFKAAMQREITRLRSDRGDPHLYLTWIRAGYAADVAPIIEEHLQQPTGYLGSWRRLAEELGDRGQHRTSSIVCRRLLDMMLAKADPDTYVEAAEVYHRLLHYSSFVAEWGPHPTDVEYSNSFHQQHDRKKTLWKHINTHKGRVN